MYVPYIPGDPRCETEVDRVGQIFVKVAVDSAGSVQAQRMLAWIPAPCPGF